MRTVYLLGFSWSRTLSGSFRFIHWWEPFYFWFKRH